MGRDDVSIPGPEGGPTAPGAAVTGARTRIQPTTCGSGEPGSGQGRTRRSLDAARRQLKAAAPLRKRALEWAVLADQSTRLSAVSLMRAIASRDGAGLVVALSHEDYARTFGGVQILISDEQRGFARAGWTYLHVSPAAPLPMLADPTAAADFRVGLRLDTDWIGITTFEDLLEAVAACRDGGIAVECIVHHLLGHVPELALELTRASGAAHPIVWVHDFFTLCPSYALMRNDVAYCGAPPPESAACGVCCYGEERGTHAARMRAFFEATRPLVLAPSEAALDLWRGRLGLPHSETAVVPHARLLTAPSAACLESPPPGRPLRVAYLGSGVFHKGWHVFEDLALRLADDRRYRFFQLGTPAAHDLPACIRNIPVSVSAERRYAMIEAVAEANIDVAVIWSLCYETFSFAVHEALAGGAWVVTRAGAGNLWPAIQSNLPVRGCAVADEAALCDLFAGEGLRRAALSVPRRRGTLIPEGGTSRWLLSRRRSRSAALR